MKIAMLCHASMGGSGAVASAVSQALVKRGHEVFIVAKQVPYSLRSELVGPLDYITETASSALEFGGRGFSWLEHGLFDSVRRILEPIRRRLQFKRVASKLHFQAVGEIDYPLFKNQLLTLTTASTLVHLLAKEKIDVIHAHYAIPFGLSALLAQMHYPSIPVILTVHGTDISVLSGQRAISPMVVSALRGANVVTAVSNWLAGSAMSVGGIPSPRVIGNFVDLEFFRPMTAEVRQRNRQRWTRDGEALLVHASNFREVKRPLDTLDILEGVRQERPARLLLVGDGPLLAEVQRAARKRGLSKQIEFLGSVRDMPRILGSADVFLLPSATESFGLAAAEALACGTTVVASDVGGVPEMLAGCVASRVHAVADTTAATRSVLELLEALDREGHQLRAAARSFAEEAFAEARVVDQYLAAYGEAIEQHALKS